MKEEIVGEIFAKLESFALSLVRGGDLDMTVDCELLDAKGGSG